LAFEGNSILHSLVREIKGLSGGDSRRGGTVAYKGREKSPMRKKSRGFTTREA